MKKEDILDKTKYNMTAMQWTAWNGFKEAIKLLLEQRAPDAVNEQEFLQRAAGYGHLKFVQTLSTLKGIDIVRENHNKRTALHLASCNGHGLVVEELISHGAKIWTRGVCNDSPLHDALRCGKEEIGQNLLSRLDDSDRVGLGNALHIVSRGGEHSAVALLLALEYPIPNIGGPLSTKTRGCLLCPQKSNCRFDEFEE